MTRVSVSPRSVSGREVLWDHTSVSVQRSLTVYSSPVLLRRASVPPRTVEFRRPPRLDSDRKWVGREKKK